jgi:hypothetical protein
LQAEARVEVFRRQPDRNWLLSESIGLQAVCRLDSLDCRLALADIYDKVTFDAGAAIFSNLPAS